MMKMKNFISYALNLVLICITIFIPVHATGIKTVAAGQCGDSLTWLLDNEGTLVIMGNGEMYNWNIDSPAPWSKHSDDIKTVIISEGVENIGECAFSNCINLSSVDLPDALAAINNEAFYNCPELDELYISPSVTKIGYQNFVSLSDTTIYADKGSEAHKYAMDNNITFGGENVDPKIYYVQADFTDGNGTFEKPYNTITQAIEHASGKNILIYIIGEYDISVLPDAPWKGTIIITGYNTSSVLTLTTGKATVFHGNATIKDINIVADANTHLNANGNKIIFDPGNETNLSSSFIHSSTYENHSIDNSYFVYNSGHTYAAYLAGAYSHSYNIGVEKDITFEMNGGEINRISLGADRFTTDPPHTGITVGNNLNLIVNGGTITQINCPALTPPNVLGAVNIIFNNGISAPRSFGYPTGAKGEYIINSAVGGKITPTEIDGIFNVEADPGKVAYINGKIVYNGTVSLSKGKTSVYWLDGSQPSVNTDTVTLSGVCGDGVVWNLDNGTLTISGSGKINDCYHATQPWYHLIKNITKVTIEEGVTAIGRQAFRNLLNLREVTLPSSLKYIADESFIGCFSLDSIVIPDNVISIGNRAFEQCESLATLSLGNKIESIGEMAFYNCKNLLSVRFPESLRQIGENAFKYNSKLEFAWFCSPDTEIGNNCFYASENLIMFGSSLSKAHFYAYMNGIYFPVHAVYIQPNGDITADCITYSESSPLISVDGEKYISLSCVTSIFGGEIVTQTDAGNAFVYKGNKISFNIGNKMAFYGEGIKTLDLPPVYMNGKTYLSLGSVKTLFDAIVARSNDRGVLITGIDMFSSHDSNAYYVRNGGYGNGTKYMPFGTIEQAISTLSEKSGTIYIYDSYDISKISRDTKWEQMLTITGAEDCSEITTTEYSATYFDGPITFKNINMSPAMHSHFDTLGHDFIFDAGNDSNFSSFMHFGATSNNTIEKSYACIESGTINNVYATGAYVTSSAEISGDATLEINGGKIEQLTLSADLYSDSMTGVSVGGNVNIIVNGGIVEKIHCTDQTKPVISGALNIVLNNSSNIPIIQYPDDTITYIVRSETGGIVIPCSEVGKFEIVANPGNVAVINGITVYDGIVTLSPGDTHITWIEGEQPKQSAIRGDANSDGVLDEKDLNAIRSHILGMSDNTFNSTLADFNSDGKINSKDLTLIQQFFTKLDNF